MKKVIERQFIATDCQKNVFFIPDLSQLIADYGVVKFLGTFGFEHGALHRIVEYIEYRTKTYHFLERPCVIEVTRVVMGSEKKYVITDNQGRRYCPYYLLSEFEAAHPKRAKHLYKCLLSYRDSWRISVPGAKRESKFRRGYFSRFKNKSAHARLLRQNAQLTEAGVKGVRKLKDSYYTDPYCPYQRRCVSRSWKRYRKTQYRA